MANYIHNAVDMSKMQRKQTNQIRNNTSKTAKTTLVLSCMSLLLCVSIVTSVNAQTIPSSSSYTNSAGTYHVVGEVENNSPVEIRDVLIAGTFYDSDNKVVATAFSATVPFHIDAGEKAPFDMMVFDEGQVKNIHNYTLQTSNK